jgi:hypothetical protein
VINHSDTRSNEKTSAEETAISPLFRLAAPDGATHRACGDLRRIRFILPKSYRLASQSLSFFLPSLKATVLETRYRIPALNGKGTYAESQLLRQVRAAVCIFDAAAAVSIGTPGPYTKNSLLFIGPDNKYLAIAKVACTAPARKLLTNEGRWLQALSSVPAMTPFIPQFFHNASLSNASAIFQRPGFGAFVAGPIRQAHLQLLSSLQEMTDEHHDFLNSMMRENLRVSLQSVAAKLSERWLERAMETLHILDVRLQPSIPMVNAHRDFVPWNMRGRDQGIYLFDWEYASEQYLPLYDLFHYILMPMVLKKRIAPGQIQQVLSDVKELGSLLAHGREKVAVPDVQLLAYLLDRSLLHLVSNNGKTIGDQVVERYGELIDQYPQWKM